MAPDDGGWWSAREPLPVGVEYAISIDGAAPCPDPRADQLPHGVHGPSRHVDHARFAGRMRASDRRPSMRRSSTSCTSARSARRAPSTAPSSRLDHLVDLGITHVELMPVTPFPGRPRLGLRRRRALRRRTSRTAAPTGCKRLVDACHARGPRRPARRRLQPPRPRRQLPVAVRAVPHRRATRRRGERRVNLDGAGSDEVRRFVIDNALMWLRDYHVDGLRIDAVHAFVDTSATHLLEELAERSRRRWPRRSGRDLVLIAESDLNDPRVVRPRELGGYGLDAQWSDDLHHALHVALTGERDGYYDDFAGLPDLVTALSAATSTRVATRGIAIGGMGAAEGLARWLRRLQPEPRPGGQSGRRRATGAPRRPRRRDGGRRAGSGRSVRAAPLPGRGVGGQHAVPVLHRPQRRGAGRRGPCGTPARVRGVRLAAGERPRPARSGDVRGVAPALGRAGARSRTPGCSPGTASSSTCAGPRKARAGVSGPPSARMSNRDGWSPTWASARWLSTSLPNRGPSSCPATTRSGQPRSPTSD